MRIVLDSDILIAAYREDGEIRDYWKNGSANNRFLISPEIFTAVENGFRKSSGPFQATEIRDFLKEILKRCEVIRPQTTYLGEMADEKDRFLANLAQASEADLILTGRTTLQKMKTVCGIPVLSFSQFIIKLTQREG